MLTRDEKQIAIRRLTNRWNEQVKKYPLMRAEISLALYIRRNMPGSLHYDNGREFLAEYE